MHIWLWSERNKVVISRLVNIHEHLQSVVIEIEGTEKMSSDQAKTGVHVILYPPFVFYYSIDQLRTSMQSAQPVEGAIALCARDVLISLWVPHLGTFDLEGPVCSQWLICIIRPDVPVFSAPLNWQPHARTLSQSTLIWSWLFGRNVHKGLTDSSFAVQTWHMHPRTMY